MKRWSFLGALALAFGLLVGVAAASTPGADVKLTHDANDPCYVSSYTIATGTPYTDATLAECSRSRGRQNEPAIAVDPRNTNVILGMTDAQAQKFNFTQNTTGSSDSAKPGWSLTLRPPVKAQDSPESLTTLDSILSDGLSAQQRSRLNGKYQGGN